LDTNFTVLLRKLINCYEANPDLTEIHLCNAEDEIAFVSKEESYKGESAAKRVGQKRTNQAIRKRLLGEPEVVIGKYKHAGQITPRPTMDVNGLESTWAEFEEDRKFQWFLNVLSSAFGFSREEIDDFIAHGEISREKLLSIMRDPDWKDLEAKHLFRVDSQPNLHLFLAKEFVASLDTVASKIERLDEIEYRDSIPSHLRAYMREAYRCDLYGLDAASAALCGSILQEAIRIKLGARGFTGLFQAIEEAEKACLLTPRAVEAAREVKRLRDFAAHGNPDFAATQEYTRISVLAATREILDTLFVTES
jgi:hypothetical protein